MSEYIERYWRDATPADAIKEPPMVARFRDFDCDDWQVGNLLGFTRATEEYPPWFSETSEAFDKCQVYDAPDPGEGWRLVDVDTETPIVGDEIYYREEKGWLIRHHDNPYDKGLTYRRRIEPPKPKYEPFKWEDREQLRGRWITYKHEDGTRIETQISHLSEHRLEGFWFKSRNPKWLLKNATFLDTGEPVGRKIQ